MIFSLIYKYRIFYPIIKKNLEKVCTKIHTLSKYHVSEIYFDALLPFRERLFLR